MAVLKEKNVNLEAIKKMSKSVFMKGHANYENAEEIYEIANPPKKAKTEDKEVE